MLLDSSTFQIRENIQGNCGFTWGFGGSTKQSVIAEIDTYIYVDIKQTCNM